VKTRTIPLDEAFWFQEGPGVRKWQFTASGVKLLNVGNILSTGDLDLSKTDRCLSREEVDKRYKHFLVDVGDLVIASSGISFDNDGLLRTRGAFVQRSHLPLCLNTSTIRFKSKSEADLRYLRFWLDSYEFRSQITRRVTGSAQQNFGPSHLEDMQISLPGLFEQQRIAEQLEQADRLRRMRRYALQMCDELLPAAFLEMFAHRTAGWPRVKIEDLAANKPNAVRTGPFGSQLLHSEFTSGGIAVLGIDNAVNNRFDWDQRRYISPAKYQQLRRYTVFPGDVIITIMGTCGRCAVIPNNIPTAINTKHLCCITLDQEKTLPGFIHASFLYHPLIRQQLGVAEKGAIMEGLNMGIIKELSLPLPPLSLQRKFVNFARKHEQLRATHVEALHQADHLFQTLLHQAFNS
jgi:type I restriction enzyme S subunit